MPGMVVKDELLPMSVMPPDAVMDHGDCAWAYREQRMRTIAQSDRYEIAIPNAVLWGMHYKNRGEAYCTTNMRTTLDTVAPLSFRTRRRA